MEIPKGNIFLKDTKLGLEDVKIMLSNLQNCSFNGYIKFAIQQGDGYIFLREGLITNILEAGSKEIKMIHEKILDNKLRRRDVPVSSYILSSEMVYVLSSCFAFQELYRNSQLKKRDFKKFLGDLEANETTGIIQITAKDSTAILLLSKGKVVMDNLLESYGDILCGPAVVSDYFEFISHYGGVIDVYGEKAEEIERRKRRMEDELARIRELVIGIEPGTLLSRGNVVKVDESIYREWQRVGNIFKIVLETESGMVEIPKVSVKRNLGHKILFTPALIKKFKLSKDEVVLAKPVY